MDALPHELVERIIRYAIESGSPSRPLERVCRQWQHIVTTLKPPEPLNWQRRNHFDPVPPLSWLIPQHYVYCWVWTVLLPQDANRRLDNGLGATGGRTRQLMARASTFFLFFSVLIARAAVAFLCGRSDWCVFLALMLAELVFLHSSFRTPRSVARGRVSAQLSVRDVMQPFLVAVFPVIEVPRTPIHSNWQALVLVALVLSHHGRRTYMEPLMPVKNTAPFFFVVQLFSCALLLSWHHIAAVCFAGVLWRAIRIVHAGQPLGNVLIEMKHEVHLAVTMVALLGVGVWRAVCCAYGWAARGEEWWSCVIPSQPFFVIASIAAKFYIVQVMILLNNDVDAQWLDALIGSTVLARVRIPYYRAPVRSYTHYLAGSMLVFGCSTLLAVVLEWIFLPSMA